MYNVYIQKYTVMKTPASSAHVGRNNLAPIINCQFIIIIFGDVHMTHLIHDRHVHTTVVSNRVS